MPPSVSILNPPTQTPPQAVALRLNLEVLLSLRQLHSSGVVPKLVVKDGRFVCIFRFFVIPFHTNLQLIKVSDSLVYPCSSSTESLRFDIYNPAGPENYVFAGTVTERLSVLSDPRQIKEHLKTPLAAPKAANAGLALTLLPEKPVFGDVPRKSSLTQHPNPYSVGSSDLKAVLTAKFLALLALGPTTKREVETRLFGLNKGVTTDLGPLFAAHTQIYSANLTFTESDTFPSVALGLTQIGPENTEDYLILKDKAYKELRPWQSPFFTAFERSLIIENIHHALSRLGYLDTHPLRRRITEKALEDETKRAAASLGGGMLLGFSKTPGSPHISPGKRSATALPRPESENKRRKAQESPLKPAEKDKKFVASLLLLSSEDERQLKRKKDGKRSNSSGSSASNTSNHSTFSSGTSYTLPLSINEEHNDEEHSEDDMKLLSLARSSPAFPAKPASTGDKRQQHYKQLAQNFYTKYLEYKELHDSLLRAPKLGTVQEKKKKVMKLFEMHNLLAGWKRKLWDFHNESNMAQGIMHLARHKKTNSGGGSALVPSSTLLLSQERFQRSGTSSPSVGYSDRFAAKPAKRVVERSPRPKVALDY